MNTFPALAILLVSASFSLPAAPLNPSNVAANAKWVLHLDMEAFRQSVIGSFLTENLLEPKLNNAKSEKHLNLGISFKNIHSITAYGPAFEKNGQGAIFVKSSANTKEDLDKLVSFAAADSDPRSNVSKAQDKPYPLYEFNGDFFAAPDTQGGLILAKTREQIDQARQVLIGKSKTLAQTDAFTQFPKVANTFLFIGVTQGLTADDLKRHPQAQLLQETDGGRLVVGESADTLFVNLVFRGKNAESSMKLHQIFQGFLALASLNQNEPAIAEIISRTKVTNEAQNVVLKLDIATAKALEKLKSSHLAAGDQQK